MNNVDEALVQMSKLIITHTKSMGVLGGRTMVLGTFLDVVISHLTTSQCVEVCKSFRKGIEDAMTLMDDVPLPAEYHSALLELTNSIVAKLNQGSAAPQ